MNFLQLLTSGASVLNFNFQGKVNLSADSIPSAASKSEGFHQVQNKAVHPLQTQNQNKSILPETDDLLNVFLQKERKNLVNRYLQLNLDLMGGNFSNQSKGQMTQMPQKLGEYKTHQSEEKEIQNLSSSKKKIKKVVKCGHDDKSHYAKGMCNNCYHKYGRNKKPWNCSHQKLYAGGMCQNCYINLYNKKKREEGMTEEKSESMKRESQEQSKHA